MDIEALRKQYLSEIEAAAAAAPAETTPEAVASYAESPQRDPARMCEMIIRLPLDGDTYETSVRTLLDVLGNDDVDTNSRLVALRQLGAAEFRPHRFAAFHAEFIDLLLRLAVKADKDLRLAALERLTLTNVAEAQKLLREGLEKARKPLVSAAKAIQLLARDDHGSGLPVFRALAANATGKIREQALRALSGDSKSAQLFESIAANQDEKSPIREIAVLALKNTSVARFAKLASNLVLDDTNDDKLRAAAVSAIAHTSDVAEKLATPRFANALEALGSSTTSRALKSSIKRFSAALRDRG